MVLVFGLFSVMIVAGVFSMIIVKTIYAPALTISPQRSRKALSAPSEAPETPETPEDRVEEFSSAQTALQGAIAKIRSLPISKGYLRKEAYPFHVKAEQANTLFMKAQKLEQMADEDDLRILSLPIENVVRHFNKVDYLFKGMDSDNEALKRKISKVYDFEKENILAGIEESMKEMEDEVDLLTEKQKQEFRLKEEHEAELKFGKFMDDYHNL